MREPGDDDYVPDDEDNDDELVPIGDVLDAITVERQKQLAQATAQDMVQRELTHHHYVDEAERMVLGAALAFGAPTMTSCEEQGLVASDFYAGRRQAIWSAIVAVHESGEHIDTITVCDELQRRKQLDEVGGASAVSSLEVAALSNASVPSCVRMIIEKARLRSVQAALVRALESTRRGVPLDDVVDRVAGDLAKVDTRGHGSPFIPAGQLVASVMDSLPLNGATPKGHTTGFADLDKYSLLKGGDLWVVGARPSMGKTSLAIDLVRHVSIRREPMSSLIISIEVSAEAATLKLVQQESGIENLAVRTWITDDMRDRLAQAEAAVGSAPIWIHDVSSITISTIKAIVREKVRECKRRGLPPIGVIVIDYLQLMGGEEGSDDNRTTQLSEISRGCKMIARELDCTVIALSQLNRGVEMRADKRPMMSDIRESGAIEQDADVIAFIYREEYYAKDRCPDDRRGIAEVLIAKNRNGPIGTVDLRFHKEVPRFENLAHEDYH